MAQIRVQILAYKKENLKQGTRRAYEKFISKPENKQKRYQYLVKWRKNHREAHNFYQKMYAIYGKKANWPE